MRRLLLVEDDPAIAEIASISLERIGGWHVTIAPTGDDALGAARDAVAHDVIVLDVMLPGMDGPETLRRLRGAGVDATAVFLTAKTGARAREQLLALGAAAVVAKPFDPLLLPAEIERVLAGEAAEER